MRFRLSVCCPSRSAPFARFRLTSFPEERSLRLDVWPIGEPMLWALALGPGFPGLVISPPYFERGRLAIQAATSSGS